MKQMDLTDYFGECEISRKKRVGNDLMSFPNSVALHCELTKKKKKNY